ncbi:MAG: SIMPL domain-containing protein [Armatimonadetes bacterium]|nr:SIMPL domain-containing protein [Armatimonadota bacterium]
MTENEMPDTITVSASANEEIEATSADIAVTMRGSSFISGNAALTKAREVAALVAALKEIGITEANIELRGVHAEVSTGALGNKSSSAVYSLRVVKTPLDKVADAVGAITSQKTAELGGIAWQFGDKHAANLRVLETALTRAKAKAELAARTLGVQIVGVRTLTETFSDDRPVLMQAPAPRGGAEMARLRAVSSEELGLEVTHRETVSASVTVHFRVGGVAAG